MSKPMRKTKLDPYQELANAVIVLAAKDYRHALRIQRRNPRSAAAQSQIDSLERFFRSDWYLEQCWYVLRFMAKDTRKKVGKCLQSRKGRAPTRDAPGSRTGSTAKSTEKQ